MSGTNLSIEVYQPKWVGSDLIESIGHKITSYAHDIAVGSGYRSANITIADQQTAAEEWFNSGLGRHIEVYNPNLSKVFEGFVNSISINVGALQATRGPLLNIANDTTVVYQTITYNTNPPIGGDPAETATASDATSQVNYGVLEYILSGGQLQSTAADAVRDTFLAEYKDPETSSVINTQSSGEAVTITLEVAGYVRLLERFYYSDATTGTRNASDKITDVLGAEPNSIFSSDYSKVSANTLQVQRQELGDRDGMTIINEVVAQGDASDNRHLFGIYNGLQATYEPIPTTASYLFNLHDKARRVTDLGGNEIKYWDILPGKWLLLTDFLLGLPATSDFRTDPRYIFVESVSYQAPWSISINGGKTNKLSQILAKQGLGGI